MKRGEPRKGHGPNSTCAQRNVGSMRITVMTMRPTSFDCRYVDCSGHDRLSSTLESRVFGLLHRRDRKQADGAVRYARRDGRGCSPLRTRLRVERPELTITRWPKSEGRSRVLNAPRLLRLTALGCHLALIEPWRPFVTEKGPSG